MNATTERVIDWATIELEYRAGTKPIRKIASDAGVSHPLVMRRAEKEGWTRDISARVQARADELVTKSVTAAVVTKTAMVTKTEKQIIEAVATHVADVKIRHQKRIEKASDIVERMFAELDIQTGEGALEVLESIGQIMRSEDDKGKDKLNDFYMSVIKLPERTKTAKTLIDALKTLVDMERQAYGIKDASQSAGDVINNLLVNISNAAHPLTIAPVSRDIEHE